LRENSYCDAKAIFALNFVNLHLPPLGGCCHWKSPYSAQVLYRPAVNQISSDVKLTLAIKILSYIQSFDIRRSIPASEDNMPMRIIHQNITSHRKRGKLDDVEEVHPAHS
jgi:hypothetical protein